MSELLNTINEPAQIRKLRRSELERLANELRAFVLDSVARTGGHLSSNLGTVELTIALHYVFNTPYDRIVWDVGHQSYPHKILTGRREAMSTLRQLNGLSGFPCRTESEYDAFGTAHSSTSISAALGMARASQLKGEKRFSIAVIGDGAMTAGMAFEAMNNAGIYDDLPLIVILNDNEMSISPPVGALNRYLARLISGRFYAAAKKGVGQILSIAPPVLKFLRRMEGHAKGILVPATLFEEFGFNYIGPIDGHDLKSLIPTLHNLKELKGPQFLHVVTKKGQGYSLAEADPVLYHGPGKFNPAEGIQCVPAVRKTYTQVFGEWLCDVAEQDERVIGITPAMREGSGLIEFEQRFPNRYYDVGIAEQHAVTFAGGLAVEGLKPVVAIYSTFVQRAYDQLIHDIALQNLPVLFAIDRAGLVGADGATHAGAYDIAFLRCIPNMTVMAASDENECRQMLYTALQQSGPTAVRYPRGAGPGVATQKQMKALPLGKGEMRRKSTQPAGQRIAILAFGSMVAPSLAAAETLNASVANMRFIKPLDEALVHQLAQTHDALVTVEEGCVMGGAGSACIESLLAAGIHCPVLQLGLPDNFIAQGDPARLLANCGLDSAGIAQAIRQRFLAHATENLGAPSAPELIIEKTQESIVL
ncbi:1-deoxy-D-xylulose-5-phosphate synthase [Mycoavidus cysteinexigens]|uniref:1-deoxy-D-xylulose-5-phosphate synthase n=1 Tax=Mycoavidus cysteinexigens TaxID=1553431 RepID=A0A2Z6EUM5_9BURK|nr:1-deoxy-D-xylulose-5-phosphate synthase [Mycoavidus cysteinexigens]BBE09160.1 1-deoxy-D-xylulose-5-phosphate synthase [Mycoavidus cysteinexigens]GAM52095.1 1-deoxy-D-xylulose 5-phosphate synthase [bacterium endosymbiont of Mortierella elongata FMR23-6]GLR01893.1 1-deoxy-D-xylulose-5-phosphate synthase [Mycoavidus cysteinexigens]